MPTLRAFNKTVNLLDPQFTVVGNWNATIANAISELQDGDMFLIPGGTYDFATQIFITALADVYIQARGAMFTTPSTDNFAVLRISNTESITIDGIRWNLGNSTKVGTGQSAITLQGCENTEVLNNKFDDVRYGVNISYSGSLGPSANTTNNTLIENCVIRNPVGLVQSLLDNATSTAQMVNCGAYTATNEDNVGNEIYSDGVTINKCKGFSVRLLNGPATKNVWILNSFANGTLNRDTRTVPDIIPIDQVAMVYTPDNSAWQENNTWPRGSSNIPAIEDKARVNELSNAFVTTEKQELSQWSFSSGLLGARQYVESVAFQPRRRPIDVGYAAANVHVHANYYGMSGLAELAFIMNGVYYRSRHNDYKMAKPSRSVGSLAPSLTFAVNGHSHRLLFDHIAEDDAIAMISGSLAFKDVLTNADGRSHYHTYRITYTAGTWAAIQLADSTGHTHAATIGVQADAPTEYRRDYLEAPAVPDAILDLPLGFDIDTGAETTVAGSQLEYMRSLRTTNAGETQAVLAYAEMWLEYVDEAAGVPDAGDSFRHAEIAEALTTAFIQSTRLTASGHKNVLENRSVGPALIVDLLEDGTPVYANPVFRISTKVVGHMGPNNAANRLVPQMVVSFTQHGHIIEPLTETELQTLLANPGVATVRKDSIPDSTNHVHQWDITAATNSIYFEATMVADATGHDHDILFEEAFSGSCIYDPVEARNAGGINSDLTGTTVGYTSTNKFKLVRDLQTMDRNRTSSNSLHSDDPLTYMANTRQARFEVENLDRMCEMCPGLDGDYAILTETHTDEAGTVDTITDRDQRALISIPLNAAKYNRRYRYSINDASNRNSADRGFNDPNLFVASTANPNVVTGFSYMIPLEIVARSCVESWNPLGIEYIDWNTLNAEDLAGNGSAVGAPLTGMNYRDYNMFTPYVTYSATGTATDVADTRTDAYMLNSNGVSSRVWASGIWDFTPDGLYRTRFPIYPVAQDFSHESVQFANMKAILKEQLLSIQAGTATPASIDDAF